MSDGDPIANRPSRSATEIGFERISYDAVSTVADIPMRPIPTTAP